MSEIDEIICRALKGQTSAHEERRLASWRRAAEKNETYYRDMLRLLEAAESSALDVVTPPPPPVAQLIAPASRRRAPGHAPDWRRSGRVRGAGALALATAAALAVLLLGGDHRTPATLPQNLFSLGEGEFVTGSAESATVVLGDGTVVRLGPESRLRIAGLPGSREVSLAGRAYFAVAKMEGIPFRVRTQAGEAVVLGTRFEVRTKGDDLRLVVVEGRVALQAEGKRVEVEGGEMSVVAGGTTSAPVKVKDPTALIEWLERFIVFQSTPLTQVAEDLEQEYGVRIEVADSELAQQTITGWYADRSFEEVLTIICSVLQANCSVEGGVARIGP